MEHKTKEGAKPTMWELVFSRRRKWCRIYTLAKDAKTARSNMQVAWANATELRETEKKEFEPCERNGHIIKMLESGAIFYTPTDRRSSNIRCCYIEEVIRDGFLRNKGETRPSGWKKGQNTVLDLKFWAANEIIQR